VLHRGRIAEMATGEGKTLVATLPLYLNALTGRGAHLVTVNNYLARRDSQWMGHVFQYPRTHRRLFWTTPTPRRPTAAGRICPTSPTAPTTSSASTIWRDNMVFSLDQRVQREHAYAIIDEVDSILIDEARTPLIIISGPRRQLRATTSTRSSIARVSEMVRKQTGVVNTLLAEAERLLENEKTREEAALKLYQAQLGMPKNKRLLKMVLESGIKQMVQKMELESIADRKLPLKQQRMRDLEEHLYFVLDEKGHSVHLTDRGAETLSPNEPTLFPSSRTSRRKCTASIATRRWTPTSASSGGARSEAELRGEEREAAHHHKAAPGARPVRQGSSITWCRTARCYRRRVSPAHHGGPAVGRMVCTMRSRPRKGFRSRKRPRPSPPITIQNYFRMYDKLAGMTGTAETEERPSSIRSTTASTSVSSPPIVRPGVPIVRIRSTRLGARNTTRFWTEGRAAPRTRVADSDRYGVRGRLRNAEQDAEAARPEASMVAQRQVSPSGEAEIVALAGQRGAITIATNMAGRGNRHQHLVKISICNSPRPASRSSGPSATSRAASIAQLPRPLPAARADPGAVHLLPFARRRPHASLRVGPDRALD